MSFEDRNLTCQDCSSEFVFTADDQQYHSDKGYTNEPKRCPDCRGARKNQQRGYSGAPREMHPVVCAQCGADTMVPFVPRGDRPVYCSDCFSAMRR